MRVFDPRCRLGFCLSTPEGVSAIWYHLHLSFPRSISVHLGSRKMLHRELGAMFVRGQDLRCATIETPDARQACSCQGLQSNWIY